MDAAKESCLLYLKMNLYKKIQGLNLCHYSLLNKKLVEHPLLQNTDTFLFHRWLLIMFFFLLKKVAIYLKNLPICTQATYALLIQQIPVFQLYPASSH